MVKDAKFNLVTFKYFAAYDGNGLGEEEVERRFSNRCNWSR